MQLQTIRQKRPLLFDRFSVFEHIGQGSFGSVCIGLDTQTNRVVAIKQEKSGVNSTIHREVRILKELQGQVGFCEIYYYKRDYMSRGVLCMTKLGKNLETLKQSSVNQKCSYKTVYMLADQMLQRIESLHSKGYLHRDIKPENFVLGTDKQINCVYLIDFGLSKSYRDLNGKHVVYNENQVLVGTPRYASVSSHLGIEQSRRDDLESLGYLLIYLASGKLPWQNLTKNQHKVPPYKKLQFIAEIKIQMPLEILCQNLPQPFLKYMTYVKNLQFYQNPNYSYLRKLFRNQIEFTDYQLDLNQYQETKKKQQSYECISESDDEECPDILDECEAMTNLVKTMKPKQQDLKQLDQCFLEMVEKPSDLPNKTKNDEYFLENFSNSSQFSKVFGLLNLQNTLKCDYNNQSHKIFRSTTDTNLPEKKNYNNLH